MLPWWKNHPSNSIDLVLSSCGVRAPCFIGGLEALLDKGYQIHRIGGSSGGAVIAAGYALGHSTEEMRRMAENIPYESFKDFRIRNLLSLSNPSVYSGEVLDQYFQDIYGGAVLGDFRIDCNIAVVTILGRKRMVLTRDTHPNMPVWKAVRMSSTIPFIFPYYEIDGIPVTDGGLITSMFDLFPDSPRPVIAFRPRADHNVRKVIQDVRAETVFFWNYLKIIAEYFLDSVDGQHVPESEWNRTVIIPTFEIGGFNFDLSPEQVQSLIQYGYNAVFLSEVLPKLTE